MQSQSLANLLRVLAVPKRIEIIDLLATVSDGLPVVTIASMVGGEDGRISEHLCRLESVGLVLRSPQGRFVFYSLNRGLVNQVSQHFRLEELPPNDQSR